MATTNTYEVLKDVNPETLAAALAGVLGYITPLIENNPDAEWRAHCPQDTLLDGNYDDAWEEGQENGEIYAAQRVMAILTKEFATA